MPDVTLTDAALAEIEARSNTHCTCVEMHVTCNDVDALIAALRASRTRERRYETALKRIAAYGHTDSCPGEWCCAGGEPAARAALREETRE